MSLVCWCGHVFKGVVIYVSLPFVQFETALVNRALQQTHKTLQHVYCNC